MEDCKFCEENPGKYTCPRCNHNYCSVACYKSPQHSVCSEAFYKECIHEELKVREPNPDSRNAMMEILQRNYENAMSNSESDDSDDDEDLVERLRDINLDDAEQVWSKLTSEEQREFLALANGGDVTKYIPLWEPWWLKIYKKPKVTFVGSSEDTSDYKSLCPNIRSNIPPLTNISKSNPSPLVFNNLINVIAAYSMTSRFFNGEHNNSPREAVSLLLQLSNNLSNNVIYDSLELAIESVASESINCQTIAASIENINQMKNDISKIALGPNDEDPSYYVLAAISDTNTLFVEAVKSAKQPSLSQSQKTILPAVFEKKIEISFSKKQLMLAEKKIKYYLSWVTSFYGEIIGELRQFLPS